MNESDRPMPTDDTSPDLAVDRLISRMIDGEASAEDERAFAKITESRPDSWRQLALRQRDAALLAVAVDRRAARAEGLALSPTHRAQRHRNPLQFPRQARRHVNWLFASAGWAAAIAMLLIWRLAAPGGFELQSPSHVQNAAQLTPEEQFRSYLKASYVLGELDPVMERVDTLPDGRRAVVAQRRIQEVFFFDEDDALPVDEERYFTKDPSELRTSAH